MKRITAQEYLELPVKPQAWVDYKDEFWEITGTDELTKSGKPIAQIRVQHGTIEYTDEVWIHNKDILVEE